MIIPKYWAEEQITKSFGGSREERVERFKTVYSKQLSERPDFDTSDPKDILNYAERLIEGVSEIQAAVKVTKAKQITISRFGWSDESQADAIAVAQKRIEEAFEQIAAGNDVVRREARVAYNGSDGVPIREEVVAKHDDIIITRNPYGSLCLNTPNVLFADIDFLYDFREFSIMPILWISAPLIALQFYFFPDFYEFSVVVGVLALLFIIGGKIWENSQNNKKEDQTPEALAMKTVEQFSERNPDWHLRVYSTPAGLRVLVMHDIFDVESSMDTFEALETDYNYINMCKLQDCFRARVSPKPWRIGLEGEEAKIYPQGIDGLWPVDDEFLEERNAWIEHYDKLSQNFAACKFEKAIGSTTVHPKAEAVRKLHDEYCRSDRGLKIA